MSGAIDVKAISQLLAPVLGPVVRELVAAELRGATAAPLLLTIAAAADRLAMSPGFIRSAIRTGRLPAVRIGRAVRVRVADVDGLADPAARTRAPARRAELELGAGDSRSPRPAPRAVAPATTPAQRAAALRIGGGR